MTTLPLGKSASLSRATKRAMIVFPSPVGITTRVFALRAERAMVSWYSRVAMSTRLFTVVVVKGFFSTLAKASGLAALYVFLEYAFCRLSIVETELMPKNLGRQLRRIFGVVGQSRGSRSNLAVLRR